MRGEFKNRNFYSLTENYFELNAFHEYLFLFVQLKFHCKFKLIFCFQVNRLTKKGDSKHKSYWLIFPLLFCV